MKGVTVAILNWNGKAWLEKFLPALQRSTYPALEICVIDNGSTDESLSFLDAHYPSVRQLRWEENLGFTEGYNKAMAHIETPYIALVNSDVEVSPGWLEPLVSRMESDPKIAAVQPKIRAWNQQDHFEYAGAAGGFLDPWGYPFCRGRIFDRIEEDQGQYDTAMQVFWASGACCLLRKSIVDEIGLFEPRFFAHMEEIDFCWRAQNHGYAIWCEPQSLVFHVGGATLPQGNPRKTFLNVHNNLAMLMKNLPQKRVLTGIGGRLILDGVWGATLAWKGEWKSIGAIIRAHWTFLGKLSFWRKRRRATYQAPPANFPKQGFYPRSIVWDFFVRKKQRWQDLQELSNS